MKKLLIVLITMLLMRLTQFAHSEISNDLDLDISALGHGDAVVVFEAGFGMSKETWQAVASEVSKFATVITYSRAGVGESKPHSAPSTIQTHVDDLLHIIKQVAHGKSVFLVGHSYGGLLATEFSQQYPDLIKGLVLLDPAVLAQRKHFEKLNAERVAHDDQWLYSVMPPQLHAQYKTLIKQMDQASTDVTPIPSQIPTILFTATSASDNPMVLEETVEGKKIWLSLHSALIRNIVNGTHYRLVNTGHSIHREHPNLVVQALSNLITNHE